MSYTELFIPDFFYQPNEGTTRLVVDRPKSIACFGILSYVGIFGLFVYFCYLFGEETTTTVTISSQVLGDPYVCSVLSPFSGQEIYNSETSESAIISRSIAGYDECLASFHALDMCNQTMTDDNILNVYGYELLDVIDVDDACVDVPLRSMRFCLGEPAIGSVDPTAASAFTVTESYPSISTSYYAVINTEVNTVIGDDDISSTSRSKLLNFDSLSGYTLDTETFISDEVSVIYVLGTTMTVSDGPGPPPSGDEVLLQIDILGNNVTEKIRIDANSGFTIKGFDVDTINDFAYIYQIDNEVTDIQVISNFSSHTSGDSDSIHSIPDVVCPSNIGREGVPIRPISGSPSDISGDRNYAIYVVCGVESVSVLGPPGTPPDFTYSAIVRSYDSSTAQVSEYSLSLTDMNYTFNGRNTQVSISYIYQVLTTSKASAPAVLYMIGTDDVDSDHPRYYLLRVDLNSAEKMVEVVYSRPPKYMHRIFTSFEGDIRPPSPLPTLAPTPAPTATPTPAPSASPTVAPSPLPTAAPSANPTVTPGSPTATPTVTPTVAPTFEPSVAPTATPSAAPTVTPTAAPTAQPTPGGTPSGSPPPGGRRLLATEPTPSPTAIPTSAFIYFMNDNGQYFSMDTLQVFRSIDGLISPARLTHTINAKLIIQYSVCNGNISSDSVGYLDFDTPSTFKTDHCSAMNGIYYQLSKMVSVPGFCEDSSLDPVEFFDQCHPNTADDDNLASLWVDMQESCEASYEKICTTVYTDNPPFACSVDDKPSFLGIVSNAFAGTEFLYVVYTSFLIISISVCPLLMNCMHVRNQRADAQRNINSRTEIVTGTPGTPQGSVVPITFARKCESVDVNTRDSSDGNVSVAQCMEEIKALRQLCHQLQMDVHYLSNSIDPPPPVPSPAAAPANGNSKSPRVKIDNLKLFSSSHDENNSDVEDSESVEMEREAELIWKDNDSV